jgi:hypothetical protein
MATHRVTRRTRYDQRVIPLNRHNAYPHWWEEFHRSPPPRPPKKTGPRLAVIGVAMAIVILSLVLTTPSLSTLTGN